jgi:hypothetical protein
MAEASNIIYPRVTGDEETDIRRLLDQDERPWSECEQARYDDPAAQVKSVFAGLMTVVGFEFVDFLDEMTRFARRVAAHYQKAVDNYCESAAIAHAFNRKDEEDSNLSYAAEEREIADGYTRYATHLAAAADALRGENHPLRKRPV